MKINLSIKGRILSILAVFLTCVFYYGCKKEVGNGKEMQLDQKTARLEKLFKEAHLENDLIEKLNDSLTIIWTPDWDKMTTKVVGGSFSYIPLVPKFSDPTNRRQIHTPNQKKYLLIKNESEFFKITYLFNEAAVSTARGRSLRSFSGRMLSVNLKTTQKIVYQYERGNVLKKDANQNKLMSVKGGAPGKIMGWEQNCETKYDCTFYTFCGSALEFYVDFSGECRAPSSLPLEYGSCPGRPEWYLSHSDTYEHCESVWVPDPNPLPEDGDGSPDQISESGIASSVVFDDGKPKIQDIKKYIDCFTDGKQAQSYTMTVFVDQPVAGQNDWFRIVADPGVVTNNPYGVPTGIVWETADGTFFDVGHTFVTFEKNNTDGTNVRQTLGFYPSANPLVSKGALENNSLHSADVSYTINVTKAQFDAGLQKVKDDFDDKQYVLANLSSAEYNCTDAAISWMNAAGAGFGNSTSGLFKNTPGDFGQVLRNKQGANLNPGSGILGKGPCN